MDTAIIPGRHVAVVDDDVGIRTLLVRILRESGYEATGVGSGRELSELMAAQPVHLVLLDIMLPGENGFAICEALRSRSQVPVIMVSARGQEVDRVAGLDAGADDYVAKPFGRAEILARVRALLRRSAVGTAAAEPAAPEVFIFAGWRYRPRQSELLAPTGAEVELTGAEQDLLLCLLRHAQRTIGRERLLEMSRNRLAHPSDRSIDVLISRLRRKMGDGDPSRPMIRTVRGVGYMLAVDVETA